MPASKRSWPNGLPEQIKSLPDVPALRLTDTVRTQVSGMLAIAKDLALSGPCVFAASLFGVKGVRLDVEDGWMDPHRTLGDRGQMAVPEVWLDDLQTAVPDGVSRAILDVMWQGFGEERCEHFDLETGLFSQPR